MGRRTGALPSFSPTSRASDIGYLFQPEEAITGKPIFRLLSTLTVAYGRMFHGHTEGWERVPRDEGALIVSHHASNALDIALGIMGGFAASGRVIYGMIHSIVGAGNLHFIAATTGDKSVALALLRAGRVVACMPGGIEEMYHSASRNGASSYTVSDWRSRRSGRERKGFAEIAVEMGPGFKVYPCFVQNGEETRFSPGADLVTLLRIDVLFGRLCDALPRDLGFLLYMTSAPFMIMSLILSISVPVKATHHVGEAVCVLEGESVEDFRERLRRKLQELIDAKQGRRHRSYLAALRQTYSW